MFDSGKSFYMCACRQDDYAPNYFLPTKQNWLDVIRASSAIPGFYRSGVSLEGINYLDGGISDAIPVKEAARQGAKTLVVIRTVPSQMYYTPQWFKRMERWLGDSSCSRWSIWCSIMKPAIVTFSNLLRNHRASCGYSKFIHRSHYIVSALGSRIPALREDYKLGRLCGRYFLATVGKLLTEKAPLTRHLVPVVTPESIVIPPAPVANDTLVAEVIDAPQANDPTFNNEDLA
ncbi:patatin-like phospholipase [Escherichia coli]|uniref:Patatin-like phospholipase n=1 Tax=Escherichia coli TaxID=562 RepID=A0A376NZN3_ECOLX|nr:patatin-like phospholipase [Escherichia coli]